MVEEEKVIRVVLTGGPSCGKTTIIEELEKRGYYVLHESAREVLSKKVKILTRMETLEMEREVYSLQKIREEGCTVDVFLDRSQIDTLAYTKYFLGYVPLDMPFPKNNYDVVFILDRLFFGKDGLRIESSEAEANEVHRMLKESYLSAGYNPVLVPAFPSVFTEASVRRRVNFILSYLRGLGLEMCHSLESTIF